MAAAVASAKDFLLDYILYGNLVDIKTDKLSGKQLQARLFNPRDGHIIDLGTFSNSGIKHILPPSKGRGSDWLVIIEMRTWSKKNALDFHQGRLAILCGETGIRTQDTLASIQTFQACSFDHSDTSPDYLSVRIYS